jgi:hypothetical protein
LGRWGDGEMGRSIEELSLVILRISPCNHAIMQSYIHAISFFPIPHYPNPPLLVGRRKNGWWETPYYQQLAKVPLPFISILAMKHFL